MAESITDFSRTKYQYTADNGQKRVLNVRTVFNTAGGGLIPADGTETGIQKAHFARHIWLEATTRQTNGNPYRRKVYFNNASYAAVINAASYAGLDGLSWTVEGHEGEKSIGTP